MHHQTFDGLSFVDVHGIYRVIYGCALKQRRELAHTLNQLNDRLSKSKIRTIAELYDHDTEFSAIADHCLALCRIKPNWLNVEMLTEFLLPHRDAGGNPAPALLQQLNFPQIEERGEGATHEEAIAALSTHTNDLEAALRLAGYEPGEAPPWDELQEILKARNEATDPKAKEAKMEASVQKSIEDAIEPGGWFAGFGGQVASPQQTDELLASLLS